MQFVNAGLDGSFFVELEFQRDERGAFARTYCNEEFVAVGIEMVPVQCNLSRNPKSGTLRGMHYQRPPQGEPKLVQCVHGRIFDVAIDLRRESRTFRKWVGTELSAEGNRLFYIPAGCAHGFLTLEADSNVIYYMGARYAPGSGAGVRWDDPAFGIAWPEEPQLISSRDAEYPDFDRTRDAVR